MTMRRRISSISMSGLQFCSQMDCISDDITDMVGREEITVLHIPSIIRLLSITFSKYNGISNLCHKFTRKYRINITSSPILISSSIYMQQKRPKRFISSYLQMMTILKTRSILGLHLAIRGQGDTAYISENNMMRVHFKLILHNAM